MALPSGVCLPANEESKNGMAAKTMINILRILKIWCSAAFDVEPALLYNQDFLLVEVMNYILLVKSITGKSCLHKSALYNNNGNKKERLFMD